MTGLSKCVVDASVGIKLFVKENLSDAAEALLGVIGDDRESRRYVPDLFFVECANVLWKYVVRHGLSSKVASKNLSDLYQLGLTSVPTPTLTPAALTIAVDLSISVYDACYVAAADLTHVPLVTADKRLVSHLAGSNRQVCFLGDISL